MALSSDTSFFRLSSILPVHQTGFSSDPQSFIDSMHDAAINLLDSLSDIASPGKHAWSLRTQGKEVVSHD